MYNLKIENSALHVNLIDFLNNKKVKKSAIVEDVETKEGHFKVSLQIERIVVKGDK